MLALFGLIIVCCIILAILALLILLKNAPLPLFNRMVKKRLEKQKNRNMEDGLHIILTGTGSPMNDANRAGPACAVVAGKQIFTVDAGIGSLGNFQNALPVGQLAAVFLTHFHSDHIGALGEYAMQRWVNGANVSPLPVYGTEGVQQVVDGFNLAYGYDAHCRTTHHSEKVAPPTGKGCEACTIPTPDADKAVLIYDNEGVTVHAFLVNHHPVPTSVGYVFTYKGRKAVISGDTAYCESIAQAAKEADVLVQDVICPELVKIMRENSPALHLKKILGDILEYHASPEDVAKMATAAHVNTLVLTHIVPPVPLPFQKKYILGAVQKGFDGTTYLGYDGLHLFLPAEPFGNKNIGVLKQ